MSAYINKLLEERERRVAELEAELREARVACVSAAQTAERALARLVEAEKVIEEARTFRVFKGESARQLREALAAYDAGKPS